MIIIMELTASEDDTRFVLKRAHSLGFRTHRSQQSGQSVIGLLGELRGVDPESFQILHGVERVYRSTRPYRLASREFKSDDSVIEIRGHKVGGKALTVIAGPCSVESAAQIERTAKAIRDAGAHMLRGGAFKPRSSPYSWQGLEEDGLALLAQAREATGLSVVSEVIAPEQVPLVGQYADLLQIGARNMQNYPLLNAVGKSNHPVLLKRGMMSTMEELLLCAEYILSHGNANVILCERGIRTFETYTRNTLDINAVPMLKELTHLPVVVDPSHATGRASLVRAVSRAAVAAGADGLLVEVHTDPQNALSDGFQSITPEEFSLLMDEVAAVAGVMGRAL